MRAGGIVLPSERKSPRNEFITTDFSRRYCPGKNVTAITACARCAGMARNARCTIRIATERSWGEIDLHVFAGGKHLDLYEKFGAQLRMIDGETPEVYFAVWARKMRSASASSAISTAGLGRRESDAQNHRERKVWELFLPGVAEGAHYKVREIRAQPGRTAIEERSVRFFNQHGVETSSLVYNLNAVIVGAITNGWKRVANERFASISAKHLS